MLVIAPIYIAREVDFGVFGQPALPSARLLFSVSYIVTTSIARGLLPQHQPPGGFQVQRWIKIQCTGPNRKRRLPAGVAVDDNPTIEVIQLDLVPRAAIAA